MPKFSCVCGQIINLSHGMSESEFSMVAERKIDELGAALADRWLSEEEFYQQIGAGATTVYRCNKCDRLHIDQGGGKFSSYTKEVR